MQFAQNLWYWFTFSGFTFEGLGTKEVSWEAILRPWGTESQWPQPTIGTCRFPQVSRSRLQTNGDPDSFVNVDKRAQIAIFWYVMIFAIYSRDLEWDSRIQRDRFWLETHADSAATLKKQEPEAGVVEGCIYTARTQHLERFGRKSCWTSKKFALIYYSWTVWRTFIGKRFWKQQLHQCSEKVVILCLGKLHML